jgi:hypothetical protein
VCAVDWSCTLQLLKLRTLLSVLSARVQAVELELIETSE